MVYSRNQCPFELSADKINFNKVYYNGFHSLKKVDIENITNHCLHIRLDSDLRDQVAFQLSNENIIKDQTLATDIATNTADTPQDFSQFNQLFNYVNYIDSILLEPYQRTSFIIAFMPQLTDQQPVYDYQTIQGSISFTTYEGYVLEVALHATVCQSILAVEQVDTGLIFEDSLIGENYIKDITIRNLSAIDLYWRLNTLDLVSATAATGNDEDCLQFVNAHTFNKIEENEYPVPAFSEYTFRVIFTPKEIGKFNYDLQIENVNDVQNIVQTRIHANIRSFIHRDSLVVSSGNVLDFGDCISGLWCMQQMVLTNVSESPIEIHFMADGAEMTFKVKTKEEDDLDRRQIMDTSLLTSQRTQQQQQQHDFQREPNAKSDTYNTAGLAGQVSPSTSSKTHSSYEEYPPSVNSYASTDVDIDMLTAFNDICSSSSVKLTDNDSAEQSSMQIEDMVLKPGVERVIQVSYRPARDESTSISAGQMILQNDFCIHLQYRPYKSAKPRELKLVQCKARKCTSLVQVSPQVIDYGDTDVGTQKSQPVTIANMSDVCAHVELVFESKVLSCNQRELMIQPRATVEVRLDIYPRKINTAYKRQIKLVNYLNNENDQIIEVSSTNMDKNRITFHSLFYQLLTPTGANFLDFGPIALNSAAIRTFTLVNVRNAPLLLGISTSLPEEITIYTKKKKFNPRKLLSTTPSSSSIQRFEEDIEKPSVVTDTLIAMNHRTKMTNVQYTSTAYLDLATVPHVGALSVKHQRKAVVKKLMAGKAMQKVTTATITTTKTVVPAKKEKCSHTTTQEKLSSASSQKTQAQKRLKKKKKQSSEQSNVGITATAAQLKKKQRNIDWPDIAGKARVPLDDLISILEHGSLSRTPLFARQSMEEQFVRYQLAWRTELDRLIEKGELVPTSLLQLRGMEEEEIILVYTPSKEHAQSLTTKKAAAISIRLIDFDQSALSSDEHDDYFPPNNFMHVMRKVIVRAQLCKSSMELGQRNINFGVVEKGERHHKTIVLHNKAETPLLYTIKKSGSIASGAIHFDAGGRHGVVRAFGKREIEFAFVPTIPGSFMDQLVVSNIRDKEDNNIISLKAVVRRPDTFHVKTKSEQLSIGPYCVTTKTGIETVVITNTHKQSKTFEIRVDNTALDAKALTRTYQAIFAIVHQENNSGLLNSEDVEEQIETLEQKVKIALRKDQPEKVEKYNKKLDKLKQQTHIADIGMAGEEDQANTNSTKKLDDEGGMVFIIEPNASIHISVCFKAIRQYIKEQTIAVVNGRILIHEQKNLDTVKILPFSAKLCTEHETCLV